MFNRNSIIRSRRGSVSIKNPPQRFDGDNYFYITNFEQTTEKECREYDKTNQNIYHKYIVSYEKIAKQIQDLPFSLDRSPQPPKKPNNYERLLKWREMNVTKNVRLQTISTLYLLSKGYIFSLDCSNDDLGPHEIIKSANDISDNNLTLMIDEANQYQNNLKNMNNNSSQQNFNNILNFETFKKSSEDEKYIFNLSNEVVSD